MTDESVIRYCVELAEQGAGFVSPNPLVGCVIMKKGKTIAAGFHKVFGGSHAEVDAFNNAEESVEGATLYVNLEPCSHTGKTPPCVDAIIANKIKMVVIGMQDPNPLVAGKGIAKLRAAGIEVKVGIIEDECKYLNRFFIKHITAGLPFISLKIAQTIDGKIATRSSDSKWITSEESRTIVHQTRSKYDAVLVGKNTALIDNPGLDVRMVKGRNPSRIVLDSSLSLPLKLNIFKFNHSKKTFIITTENAIEANLLKVKLLKKTGIVLIAAPVSRKTGRIDLKAALKLIAKQGICSVLVEGGSAVFTNFIKQKLADEIIIFISPKILGSGIPAFDSLNINKISQAQQWQIHSLEQSGTDIMVTLQP